MFTLLFLKRSKKECIYINVFIAVYISPASEDIVIGGREHMSTHWSSTNTESGRRLA